MPDEWQHYQDSVARLFERMPGAEVDVDVRERGSSGVVRQLDVRIRIEIKVPVSEDFELSLPVSILVDCKRYARRLNVQVMGEVYELKEDVGAHLAVVVSPLGVTSGARARAPSLGIYPITVTDDLLVLAEGEAFPEIECLICDNHFRFIQWDSYGPWGQCQACSTSHVRCGDCFAMIAFPEENGEPNRCPGCRLAVHAVSFDAREGSTSRESVDALDVMILRELDGAVGNRLPQEAVDRIISSTRWRHWTVDASPLIGLTEDSRIEMSDDGFWHLAEEGRAVLDRLILPASDPPSWLVG